MFISSAEDRFNRYFLNLSQLDTETGKLEATEELGKSYGDNANIKIGECNNELWLSWVQFDSDIDNNIIITGHLNNELDFQEFSRNPGINPSFFVDGDEKVIINSRQLEKGDSQHSLRIAFLKAIMAYKTNEYFQLLISAVIQI